MGTIYQFDFKIKPFRADSSETGWSSIILFALLQTIVINIREWEFGTMPLKGRKMSDYVSVTLNE